MSRFPYNFFEEFVVRTPLFSYKTFIHRLSKDDISDIELREIYSNVFFQEAVYLASPDLYNELRKWFIREKEYSEKDQYRLKNTLLKYFSRISSRCTPFGLFAGVGLGIFNSDISILSERKDIAIKMIRHTTLDMHFLVLLSQYFTTISEIREKLLFFPSTSIYKVRNKLRYIEYEYVNGKREYITSTALLSKELERILHFSQQGKTISQIADILVNEDITKGEAKEFVEELIENQLLISELEPHVSGVDFLSILISFLKNKEITKEYNTLITIRKKLEELDGNISNDTQLYREIENLIKSFQIKYEGKFLFQTDLYYQNKIELPLRWKNELKTGISFLNKITLISKETYLERFKKAFLERFDQEEIPLLYALDTEIGIGYRQDIIAKGVHPYLAGFTIPVSKGKQELNIRLTSLQILLNQKLQEIQFEDTTIIQLTDEDSTDYAENWEDIPDTLSIVAEIISENNQEKLVLQGYRGGSAANLLARFSSEKSDIRKVVKSIAEKESELNSNYILAEILHLPEARIGNIIRRPSLRSHEIPYLAQSILPKENQISVDDLYISVRENKIVLRSKKLNKEIKPYLSNSHKYSANSLPVYHFLCDLHSQNIHPKLQFDWGDMRHLYIFLPRIEYKNIIISRACWRISEKDLRPLKEMINNKLGLLKQSNEWRLKRKIPAWVQWVRNDNTLTLNLENYEMLKLFIQIVSKEKVILIEEFLYNENDNFKREFIFPMYKDKKN
ncbi:lantibiotic dehydratase [Chryseobacterium sp. RP-3-3]|uniref:Lantibiotic dehydratase n=1 Tax=Chryseobacterium antibioticum TaxID=2728847 RepID=A0A7Y0ANW6_9FLAO|nr:lantibiotic dehydratase family protein [Chryseobacterium antibioticum]NML70764.1 lantibiotic dehydratase [Chryseobacterium antibioticum]